jgi:isopentenyl-diphosphate delta-isomerase
VLVASVSVPVIAKEVGWGISGRVATRLVEAGVAAIDVAGAGGTSWSQVEMHRATEQKQADLAARFVDWGIPTAEAVRQVRAALPETPLIASGGLRSGLDIAKSIALGAQVGGMAGPFLRAAAKSSESVSELIHQTVRELRVCMFATGSHDLESLRTARWLQRP